MKYLNGPEPVPCPQCRSLDCGTVRCRFSLIDQEEFKKVSKRLRRFSASGQAFKLYANLRETYEHAAKVLGVSLVICAGTSPFYEVARVQQEATK